MQIVQMYLCYFPPGSDDLFIAFIQNLAQTPYGILLAQYRRYCTMKKFPLNTVRLVNCMDMIALFCADSPLMIRSMALLTDTVSAP